MAGQLMTDEVFTNGYATDTANKERNFEVLCREWFELFVASTTSSTTEESRRTILKNHVYPEFGMLDIHNVDLNRLQRFFNEKVKAGLSADHINKMKNLLNNFMVYAVKKHYIKANPMEEVVIKNKGIGTSGGEEKDKALRQEIRQQVFAWVAEDTLLKPIVITFAFTGLQPQELIALEWQNVNLDAKTIVVKKAVNRVINFDDDGNVVSRGATVGKTKTPKSVRTIIMPDIVVGVLKEWQSYCEDNHIQSKFVFPNTKTGGMRTYSGLRSLLERFIKKYGLQEEKITLYTFRHTFATVLLEERENPRCIPRAKFNIGRAEN